MLLIALAATGGGILSALAGWKDSNESFDFKKFRTSLATAILAGAGFAVAYAGVAEITQLDYLTAFLSGAGLDAGFNRVKGVLKKGPVNTGGNK